MGEPIVVPHPFLTVVGGMTPGMLSELSERKGREDGLLARLLFAYPDRAPRPYSEQGISDHVAGAYGGLIKGLWERPMREVDGKPSPHVVRMTPEAHDAWAGWCRAHRDEQDADDFPESLEGAWGKLEAYAVRLALILHLMDLAADPSGPVDAGPPVLPRRVIDGAARLVAYFKSHARRVYDSMGGKAATGDDNVRALLGWIGRNDLPEFTERDIARNFDRFKDDPAALADALEWMIGRNLIQRRPEPEARKPGRKPSPTFEVNPALKDSPRFRRFRRNSPVAPSFVGNVGNAGDSGVEG
jgi:hypothetical protein